MLVIIKEKNRFGKIEFTEDELRDIIDKARLEGYNQGLRDGKSNSWNYPVKPYWDYPNWGYPDKILCIPGVNDRDITINSDGTSGGKCKGKIKLNESSTLSSAVNNFIK